MWANVDHFRIFITHLFSKTSCVAQGHCRISPPCFLAECCKRQLEQGSFVLLYFRLFTFSDLYWVCLFVFSCTVLFVSISQVIGCEDRLQNDLYYVEWGVKLYSNSKFSKKLCLWSTLASSQLHFYITLWNLKIQNNRQTLLLASTLICLT